MLSRHTGTLILALSLAGLACSSSTDYGSGGGGTFTPPTADVLIVPGAASKTTTAYSPNPFTVSLNGGASASVKWGDGDPNAPAHTVTANGATPLFDSGNLAPGDTFTFQFTAPGTYDFHCKIHTGMTGSVVVNP